MHNFLREVKQTPFTIGLCVLLVAIYIAEVLNSGGLTIGLGTLYDFGGLVTSAVGIDGQWWRLLTAGFVHASLMHILMNTIVIYFIGRILETTLGSLQVATIFILGVLGGSLLSMTLGALNVIYIGASSGAFAMVGAVVYLGMQEKRRGAWVQQMQTMLIFVAMNLLFSLFDPTIGIWGHVGGFFVGLAVTGNLLQSRYAKMTFKNTTMTRIVALLMIFTVFLILLTGAFTRLTTFS